MKEHINLKDLLGLSNSEIANSKINLNMTANGVDCLKIWQDNNNDVLFNYWSHQGEWTGGRLPNRNFHLGNIVYGFVKLDNERWLLVTVGKITSIPEITDKKRRGDFCSFEVVEKYAPLFGRLIIKLKKGNKFSRYAFNLSTFIEECYVEQILPVKYGVMSFPGFGSINMRFRELNKQIENLEWKSALQAVNGVYLITDISNNKKYVGSAYGSNGIYGRWRVYLDYGYDENEEESGEKFPNSQLKRLVKEKGLSYINDNFYFSILETVPDNYPKEYIIKREQHWKRVLNTINTPYGYNSN